MLLPSNDGITCDQCGEVFTRKFTYFSCEFTKVLVDAEQKIAGPTEVDKKYLNLDICEKCYEKMKRKCLAIIRDFEAKRQRNSGFTVKAE
jgi:hypothetical protein